MEHLNDSKSTRSGPGNAARGRSPRWRRLLALAGTTAAAAAVTGTLVLSSGPNAQPAAAAPPHRNAAAASDAAAGVPGAGQFFYRKFHRLELEGWIPSDSADADIASGSMGAPMVGPGAEDSFTALVPTTQEWWTGADGSGRTREVAGTPQFLTAAEQSRWEAAGSPLPPPFDPGYQKAHPPLGVQVLEVGPGVVDTEHGPWKYYKAPDTSDLPTDPATLRAQVEANAIHVRGFNPMNPSAEHLDPVRTARQLLNVATEGNPTPELQAAIFDALAELPAIKVRTGATDGLGRQGDAIRLPDARSGTRAEYIFDSGTSVMLAQRTVLVDPGADPLYKDLPAGTTISETDYLKSGVVDSTQQ
jgi:hypothetical protein